MEPDARIRDLRFLIIALLKIALRVSIFLALIALMCIVAEDRNWINKHKPLASTPSIATILLIVTTAFGSTNTIATAMKNTWEEIMALKELLEKKKQDTSNNVRDWLKTASPEQVEKFKSGEIPSLDFHKPVKSPRN